MLLTTANTRRIFNVILYALLIKTAFQLEISVGIVAVDDKNEIVDQYPESAMNTLNEILSENKSLEVSSVFLDVFGINKIVVTGFSAAQMTYANRQVVDISALSDDDYIIQSTDY